MKKSIVAFAIILLISKIAVCQFANLEFVENKGQWDNRVKFKGEITNGAFFLQEKGFRVLQKNQQDMQQLTSLLHGDVPSNTQARSGKGIPAAPSTDKNQIVVRAHAYNVEFVNASTPVIVPDKPLPSYNNYILGNNPAEWKGNCRIYQAITYKNMYPGIDVRYYTSEGKLKYDLVIQPGADISKLAMKYDGVDELQVKNGELVIKTSVGDVHELAPYAYQMVDGVKKEVQCSFKVTGKTVSFSLKDYAKSNLLVIDPTLVFSTFTGSVAYNWGYTATYGPDGSFYAGGIAFGEGFPTTTGAFNVKYNGGVDEGGITGYDIAIMKFTSDGSDRVYATYIGGKTGNEQPHSLVVDAQGNLVIAGRTNAPDYPTTITATTGGGYDIILTKLNASGSALIGSRKIGGSGSDGVNIKPKDPIEAPVESIDRNYGDDARSEVILDGAGNILVATNSQSTDFPVVNAFQPALGGKQDAVIIKTSPDVSTILTSTFLGGTGNDAAFVLAINPVDNTIYVGGNTDGTDLPGDKTGVVYPAAPGGLTDGFVAILSNDVRTLLKSTYIGTSSIDMLYGIQFDRFGFPYIMGTTTGDWPVTNAAFSQAKGKQFIAKLKPDLSAYEYSTVFGTGSANPNISPVAFLVDRCENVYVSGWGGSTDNGYAHFPNAGTAGLTVTPNAIQSTTDNSDFYFFVLERNATSQLYGSFFGQKGGFGEHVDGGTSRFDRNGVIYQALCANCGHDVPFPTTPGVWSPSNGSEECNLAAVKIAFNLAGVAGSVRASINGAVNDTSGCVPLTVNFTDTLAEGKRYIWNFGDGSAEEETTAPTISHTYNSVGSYRVRLTSIDSSKCNVADSAYTTIRVRTDKAILGISPKKLAPCSASNYEFTNTSYVSPSGRAFAANSFTWYFGDNTPSVIAGSNPVTHAFPGPGIYKVRLVLTDTNFCNAPDSIEISLRVATNVKAAFQTPPAGCAPYTAAIQNLSSGGQQFLWSFGDGETSDETTPTHIYTIPGTYTINLKAIDSGTCNIVDSAASTVIISGKPTASYTFTPDPPQENTPVQFLNSSIGADSFLWEFGDGETLSTTTLDAVQHAYNETGTYNSCLIASNSAGCTDSLCKSIVARIVPFLDVSKAFTPNGDGINDKVFVRGYGISKMTWRIYNRWGSLIFQTSDRTQGWDGTYNGAIQPSEVYHYVLNVQYTDKSTNIKKGDITLLR